MSPGDTSLSFTFRSLCLPCAPWAPPKCLPSGVCVSYWLSVFYPPHPGLTVLACAACASRALPIQSPLFELLWERFAAACGFAGCSGGPRYPLLRRVQRPSSSRNRLENECEMMAWPLLLLSWANFGHYSRTDPPFWRTWSVWGCRNSEVNEWRVWCFRKFESRIQWEGDSTISQHRRRS